MDAEVEIEEVDWDEWLRLGDELSSQIDPEDLNRMNAALEDADIIAKEQMRREMGLS